METQIETKAKTDVVSHPIVPMCDCPACGHRHWKKKQVRRASGSELAERVRV